MNVAEIIADGVVDADEAAAIRAELYADGLIDKGEMDQLFEINDAVTGNDNAPEWDQLMVDAISDGVLADEESPNEIDAEEAAYLIEKIGADGQVDGVEKAILENIIAKATKIDQTLVDFAVANGIAA